MFLINGEMNLTREEIENFIRKRVSASKNEKNTGESSITSEAPKSKDINRSCCLPDREK